MCVILITIQSVLPLLLSKLVYFIDIYYNREKLLLWYKTMNFQNCAIMLGFCKSSHTRLRVH